MSKQAAVAELIHRARREGWAVGQFNMSSLDTLHGIVDAANETHVPCLVGVSMGTLRYAGMQYVAGLMRAARVTLWCRCTSISITGRTWRSCGVRSTPDSTR